MKKQLSILCIIALLLTFTLPTLAALPNDNPVSGNNHVISRTVRTSGGTESVSAYYNTDISRDVLSYVNEERARAGVAPLSWNSDLEDAAVQRAAEIYVMFSHTRPDGSKFNTVAKNVNGENLAYGNHPDYYTAAGVMESWMGSPGHRSNILDPDFKSMAAASITTDQGTHWVQIFSASTKGSSASSRSSGSNAAAKPGNAPANTATPASDGAASGTADSATVHASVAKKVLTAAKKSNKNTVTVGIGNQKTLSQKDIRSIVKGTNKSVILYANTKTEQNKLQARLYVNVNQLANRKGDFKLGVYTDNAHVGTVKKAFKKSFPNTLMVIKIQEQNLGTTVTVAVKGNFKNVNTNNLAFYHYNTKNKTYNLLPSPQYYIGQDGLLYFNTAQGGYIIVSQGALA